MRIWFTKLLRTFVPCCLQSLVISEGHCKKGIFYATQPRNEKNIWKRAAFPARAHIQLPEQEKRPGPVKSCCVLFYGNQCLQVRGMWNSLQTNWNIALGRPPPANTCSITLNCLPGTAVTSQIQGFTPTAPSPLFHHAPLHLPTETRWGASSSTYLFERLHSWYQTVEQKGEAATLEDSVLQNCKKNFV